MGKTRVKLTICGSDYIITSDDSESYVRFVGDKVNDKMNSLLDNNPKLSISMVAILSALDFCDELNKSLEQVESFKLQLSQAMSDASEYQDKYQSANVKIDDLKSEIESLRRTVDEYKDKVDLLNNSLNDISNSKKEKKENEVVTFSLLENEIDGGF